MSNEHEALAWAEKVAASKPPRYTEASRNAARYILSRATPSPSTDTLERREAIKQMRPAYIAEPARRIIELIAGAVGTMAREGDASFHAACEAIMRDTLPLFQRLGMDETGEGLGFDEDQFDDVLLTPSPRVDEGRARELADKARDHVRAGDHRMAYFAMCEAFAAALATTLADPRVGKMEAALSDPNAVHVNMLRGSIAKPSTAQIWHIYGAALLADMPDDVRAHLPNTGLSDERAREVLADVCERDGRYAHADFVRRGDTNPDLETTLRAMHQYAAGLRGALAEIAKMGPETASIWAAEKARTALGDTQS